MAPLKHDPEYRVDFTNQEVKDFMVKFYEASNHPEAHEDYANLFTRDGTVIFASSEAKGVQSKSTPLAIASRLVRPDQVLI